MDLEETNELLTMYFTTASASNTETKRKIEKEKNWNAKKINWDTILQTDADRELQSVETNNFADTGVDGQADTDRDWMTDNK